MSAQSWFFGFEILSGFATLLVIIGLFKEYGLDVLKAFKLWGTRETHAHVEIETASKRQGSALVVIGIAIELIGTVGIFGTSLRIETQHRGEIATLETRIGEEQSARLELQYVMQRFSNGRHVSIESSHSRLCCPNPPPSAVLIQNVGDDPEADELAGEIGSAVQFSWRGTRRVDALDTNVTSIDDGVAIYCAECGSPSTSEGNARTAEQIRDLLMGWPNEVAAKVLPLDSLNVLLPSSFPKGAILILVGKHSVPFDVSVFVTGPPENHAFLDTLAKMPARYRPSMMRGYLAKPTKP